MVIHTQRIPLIVRAVEAYAGAARYEPPPRMLEPVMDLEPVYETVSSVTDGLEAGLEELGLLESEDDGSSNRDSNADEQ